MKKTNLIADGISLVEQRAFQSFVCHLHKKPRFQLNILIPSRINKHLSLDENKLVEVAIRPVTIQYARENYGDIFISFKVRCPKCGEQGVLSRLKPNCFVIFHSKQAGYHYAPIEVAKKLIEENA